METYIGSLTYLALGKDNDGNVKALGKDNDGNVYRFPHLFGFKKGQ